MGKKIVSKYAHLPNYRFIKDYQHGVGDYEGQVVDGLPHGEGKMTRPGGGVAEGTWYKGKFQRKYLINYDNLPPGFVLTGA